MSTTASDFVVLFYIYASVVETPGDDETVLVQYGKTRVRVKRSDMRAIKSDKKKKKQSKHSSPKFEETELNKDEDVCYGPRVHCSSMSASEPHSVIFVVHGTGTGAVKECALEVQGELTLPHAEETSLVPVSPLAECPLAGE
uniref:Uncharacterized protein n=1 Tax=Populus trichocarpa TaxID=3694 RepID=A0A2K1YFT4_POPTR